MCFHFFRRLHLGGHFVETFQIRRSPQDLRLRGLIEAICLFMMKLQNELSFILKAIQKTPIPSSPTITRALMEARSTQAFCLHNGVAVLLYKML